MKVSRTMCMHCLQTVGALLLLALLSVLPKAARAQDLVPQREPGPDYDVSIVSFRGDRSPLQTVCEVYVAIGNDQLLFLKSGETYQARYEVELKLTGPKGDSVFDETTQETASTPVYEETFSENIVKVHRFVFETAPGEYELDVWLQDASLKEKRRTRLTLTIPTFRRETLGVSDIILTDFLSEGPANLPPGGVVDWSNTRLFVRKGHVYLPNTRGIYANYAPSLTAYYEVYGLNPLRQEENDGFYRVEYYVENDSGEVLMYYMRKHEKPGHDSYNSVEMNIQDLPPGDYQMQIAVTDMGSSQKVTTARPFKVLSSYLTLVRDDYGEAVDQLRYIASERELKILREADESRRVALFREFWASKDPTPGSKTNETLVEYYRRITYADEHFKTPNQAGWATDRGMVFITLGAPDQVDRNDMARYSMPSEIWVYNGLQLKLIFLDHEGFGNFQLENRDDYWERVGRFHP